MTANTDEISLMISDCEKRESFMSEWECNFIQSLSEQHGRGKGLTIRQKSLLDKIWEKVT